MRHGDTEDTEIARRLEVTGLCGLLCVLCVSVSHYSVSTCGAFARLPERARVKSLVDPGRRQAQVREQQHRPPWPGRRDRPNDLATPAAHGAGGGEEERDVATQCGGPLDQLGAREVQREQL